MTRRVLRLGLVIALGLGAPLGAQQAGTVAVHGYGTWSYGRTGSANEFLSGNKAGSFDHVDFSLNVGAALAERVHVAGQVFVEEGGEEESRTTLDFLYAEWRLSDALRVRMGDVKQPFGVYTEIFDLGTVRPFLALPQSIYGGGGFVGESYRGAGVTGDLLAGSWGLTYDLYGGGLSAEEEEAPIEYLLGEEPGAGREERTTNMVGGRLMVRTPLPGLSLGVSAYNGEPAEEAEEESEEGSARRASVMGAQLEYLTRSLTLRAEFAGKNRTEVGGVPMEMRGGYVETGYRLGDHWQLAGLYDRQWARLEGLNVSRAPSLLQHTAVAGGVNLWVTSNLVLKTSLQRVQGNRFAAPEWDKLEQAVDTGRLERRTTLLNVGVQMSF